ncbi:MAG: FeoA family protein [Ignisphaera sp.]|nr:ferrous iron transport protein A [Ignisphaera sp.]MDW8085621.1 FeoA family protein [Ignisphaera sp.]
MARVKLSSIQQGGRVRVVEILLDSKLQTRLINMGLTRGATITVICRNHSSTIIMLNSSSGYGRTIALSKDVAERIIVEAVDPSTENCNGEFQT